MSNNGYRVKSLKYPTYTLSFSFIGKKTLEERLKIESAIKKSPRINRILRERENASYQSWSPTSH